MAPNNVDSSLACDQATVPPQLSTATNSLYSFDMDLIEKQVATVFLLSHGHLFRSCEHSVVNMFTSRCV
jgi:hypothetical protein